MSFGILTVIVLAGLAGPLLAAGPVLVPVVVGEILAGLVIGDTGFGWVDPTRTTATFLSNVGFAMLMFTAGLHLPVRGTAITRGLRRGTVAMIVVSALSVPAGIAAARATGTGHAAVYALLLASGSAAVIVPVLTEAGLLADDRALVVLAQVAVADVAAIIAVPIVLQPSRTVHASLGGLAVATCVLALFLSTRLLRGRPAIRAIRRRSKKREWALDLRLSLLVLFGLSWVAVKSGTSVLIAGFGVGLIVAGMGGPKRFSRQVIGLAQGFFVPLFFVLLGARLDLKALGRHPSYLALAGLLIVLNVAVHGIGALVSRQSLGAGLAATAQLGVPAAVVAIGLQERLLQPGQAAAILLAALATLGLCPAGAALLAQAKASGTGLSAGLAGAATPEASPSRSTQPEPR